MGDRAAGYGMLAGSQSRRAVLQGLGLGGLALSVSGCALGQRMPAQQITAKGAAVWRGMDQAALDAAYDQSVWTPNMKQVIARNTANSDRVRARMGQPRQFSYGPTTIETLEVYCADQAGAPIAIFLHGGAWRQARAREFGFLADLFVGAGVNLVIPDFAWVQDVGGDLTVLADQVRRSVEWVYRNAARFGGDAERIHVCGHSSGAHLAAVLLTTDWPGLFGLPENVIKAGFCLSGMYDLEPVRLSARSDYIAFTDRMEHLLSPQRHLEHLKAPVVVACGSAESPEFLRHAQDFAAAVQRAGKPAQLLVAQGYNHLEVLEALGNPYSEPGRALTGQLRQI